MQIEERTVGNVVVLDLKGKITLGEGDEALRDRINQLVQKEQKRILLNLADVPYIDSAGLGEIVRTYTTVKNRGGLIAPDAKVAQVDTEQDALKGFS